jgi:hypothetical protein
MEQYGAHIIATTRRMEFAADAAASRLAATARRQSAEHVPSPVTRRRIRTPRPAAA